MKKDFRFRAKINFFPTKEGGRLYPAFNGYRPILVFNCKKELNNKKEKMILLDSDLTFNTDCILYYHKNKIPLGKEIHCFIEINNYTDKIIPFMNINIGFLISEMFHVVGYGHFTHIVNDIPFKNGNSSKDINDFLNGSRNI